MKNLILLLTALFFVSCSKEELYGPRKLANGQEVELLVDHRYASDSDVLLHLPANEPAGASLAGFKDRQPGFVYRVKARFNHQENPPQDGPGYWFDFLNVISKEQYKGSEAFNVNLIVSYIPGGPFIRIEKQVNEYFLVGEKIQLTYTDPVIGNQLEEIAQNARTVRESWPNLQQPKWKSIKATVVHDPKLFGQAYLVQQLQFN